MSSWNALSHSAAEDLDESPSELDVEGGVDYRVEGAVDIAQPCESAVKPRRDVARPAVGVQYMSHKERQPADEEDSCRGQRKGREKYQIRNALAEKEERNPWLTDYEQHENIQLTVPAAYHQGAVKTLTLYRQVKPVNRSLFQCI